MYVELGGICSAGYAVPAPEIRHAIISKTQNTNGSGEGVPRQGGSFLPITSSSSQAQKGPDCCPLFRAKQKFQSNGI